MTSRYNKKLGTLDRIAKRRYTRELFDDIISLDKNSNLVTGKSPIASCHSNSRHKSNSHPPENSAVDDCIITLLRCFNNFFNRSFDGDRLFKALEFLMVSTERTETISNWLHQKKADNIYVIGRFILQIVCYLECCKCPPLANQQTVIRQFLDLTFSEYPSTLDENYILIFGFLARKGFFRSLIGFVSKLDENDRQNWVKYLWFPLKFAVNWRVKIEQWMKREVEKKEIYGSNVSLDEDYACSALMTQSIISMSSDISSCLEEPHSKQTRVFLKRLLSSWFNSIYFNDQFFSYHVTDSSIKLANQLLTNSVPIYLIILVLLEPIRMRRRYSIDSIQGANKTLAVQYRLNISPSVGCLELFAVNICSLLSQSKWSSIGHEEAYGIVVIIHLIIVGLYDQMERGVVEEEKLKSISTMMIGQSALNLLQLALSSDQLDPDATLPLCYFIQNIQYEFQLDSENLFQCKLVLIKQLYLMRYTWNVLSGAIPSFKRRTSSTSGNNTTNTKAVTNSSSSANCTSHSASSTSSLIRRKSSRKSSMYQTLGSTSSSGSGENDVQTKFTVMKMIVENCVAQLSTDDFVKYVAAMSTYLECLICYMNTLYINECRRKISHVNNNNNNLLLDSVHLVSSAPLSWKCEITCIAKDVSGLARGLIKVFLGNGPVKHGCSERDLARLQSRVVNLLKLIRVVIIHLDKLNKEQELLYDMPTDDIELSMDDGSNLDANLEQMFNFDFNIKGLTKSQIEMKSQILLTEIIPTVSGSQEKLKFLGAVMEHYQKKYSKTAGIKTIPEESRKLSVSKSSCLFREFHKVFQKISVADIIHNNQERFQVAVNINENSIESSVTNENSIKTITLLELILLVIEDGVAITSSNRNQLFSRDVNHSFYPNPYALSQSDLSNSEYYRFIGRLIGLMIVLGGQLNHRFAPFFLNRLIVQEGAIFNINDLNSVDMEVAKNLMLLSKAEEDGLECFKFNFTLTQNSFGKLHNHEMVKDGKSIPVTMENKGEYIHRVVQFILDKQICHQTEYVRDGICEVFPVTILQILSAVELQLLMSSAN